MENNAAELKIEVINRESGALEEKALTLKEGEPCLMRLTPIPGATAVQMVVREAGKVLSAIEVSAQPGETVTIELRRLPDGLIMSSAKNRDILILADEPPAAPLLLQSSKSDELDIVVLVDGTCLHPSDADPLVPLEYLLSPPLVAEWKGMVKKLTTFIAAFPEGKSVWSMALAFGDREIPVIEEKTLQPRYMVHPAVEAREWDRNKSVKGAAEQLGDRLTLLPFSPGGDFVDALADGLRACRELPWRQNSRKLLLVFGHSPGYSILEPPCALTNLQPRRACIEEELAILHQRNVEIVTLFHHPTTMDARYTIGDREVINHSRQQYTRMATMGNWAAEASGFDPVALAKECVNPPPSIARGACPGIANDS